MPATPVRQSASRKPPAMAEIERLGFGYAEEAQYDLERLSPERRVQVREVAHYAPRESVARYAIQMNESTFPAIVVTSDAWLVDGNTRVGACALRKTKFFPAIVLDVAWEGAPARTQNELRALAATLNSQNGVPLTAKEIRAVTPRFIELNWRNEQIARAIGVKASSVTQVRKEIEAAAKLARVGMDDNGSLRGASLRALGSQEALALNDAPYRDLATLAADAGLNSSEIITFAREARQTGSDVGAGEHLERLRAEMEQRIRDRELTGVGRPPAARQLRQHLGYVVKFIDREQELVEMNEVAKEQHIEAIERAIEVLRGVLRAQR